MRRTEWAGASIFNFQTALQRERKLKMEPGTRVRSFVDQSLPSANRLYSKDPKAYETTLVRPSLAGSLYRVRGRSDDVNRGIHAKIDIGRASAHRHARKVPVHRRSQPPVIIHAAGRRRSTGPRDGRDEYGRHGQSERRARARALKSGIASLKGRYPDRFVVFANVDFSGIDDPNWGKRAAAQLEEDVRNGAQGLEDLQEPRNDGQGRERQARSSGRSASGSGLGSLRDARASRFLFTPESRGPSFSPRTGSTNAGSN